jgi:hypothetical protein
MTTKYLQNPMKKAFIKLNGIVLSLFAFCISSNAQMGSINYTYDNNGNRTSAWTSMFSCVKKHPSDSTKKDSTKTDSVIALKHGINVYPNPTSGQVTVAISSFQPCGTAVVYLQDASGNELMAQKATSSPVLINLSNYIQGVFYIKVIICDDQVSYKVIKVSPGISHPPASSAPVLK